MTHSPEDYARALLTHLKIERVDDVEQAAKQLRLSIREVSSTNFEGALVRIPQSREGIIALKNYFREPARRRFTVLHEVAHFILPGHGQDECYCTSAQIESWRNDAIRRQEYEANRFASELLLPSRVLYPIVNSRDLTLARIKELAAQFDTSLTATTVKSVDVTEESCAVICSVNRKVKWVHKSETFHYNIPAMILGQDCLAGQLFEDGATQQLEGPVAASSWTENDNVERGKEFWEESISMPFYGSVLTILTARANRSKCVRITPQASNFSRARVSNTSFN
ncbi:MAG: ImmA/IrrE family metallo-endopeptidase [Chloracidobacterium sp.]|nr:ImmA/IrrE family metallo-endopeptidase [Chloracidobacterium sp.]